MPEGDGREQGTAQEDQAAVATTARSGQRSQPQAALQTEGLVKTFGSKVAVDHLDLEVPVGSFYGIVGPNGAGKTTMLSMATGLLRPDAGRVRVHGVDVWADLPAAKARLGVLPDGLRTFDRLNGLELVTYSGLLRGLDRDIVVPRATELIQVLGLWEAGTTIVADYSAGMRKKVHLACAMVHSPSILVLDEPFEAVDPISAQTIQTILRNFAEAGGTVVVSSHVMATVERLCDHVAIINAGRVAVAGTTEEVAAGGTLEERFTQLVGGEVRTQGLSWLQPSSR
ncbi:ABC transporter ATP-binding protein [Actinomyces lilanjuaniae]|uniref:ABC transporter ATP-binding protein n=1 Tax=Actinomyces lilanjuaniae TaxID=2321394 RepID=A0ABN5PP14_9ACTO|nr:ABC transporter ATP-binding protein [Actinomyces lilanjuaniae]